MAPTLTLEPPSARHSSSFKSLLSEFEGEDRIPFTLLFDHRNIHELIAKLENCSRGVDLPEGFVPHSTFWLIENDIEVVGVSNIRHRLTNHLRHEGGHIGYSIRPSARGQGYGREILRLTLLEAKRLGIDRALVTCGKANLPSAAVIRANGGVWDSEEFIEERGEVFQRYWIDLKSKGAV